MYNRFSIVISDIHGSKHFSAPLILKDRIQIILFTITSLVFVGFFILLYSLNNTLNLKDKNEKLGNQITELKVNENNLYSTLSNNVITINSLTKSIQDINLMLELPGTEDVLVKSSLELMFNSIVAKQLMLSQIPNGYPVTDKGITGKFGKRRHPLTHKIKFHKGIDLRAVMNTPIKAVANAVISFEGVKKNSGYGLLLVLNHNYGFKTTFGHLNKVLVKKGDIVKKGQIIAYSGNTGLSTAPHLHYEISFLNTPLSPENFLRWNIHNFRDILNQEKHVPWNSLLKVFWQSPMHRNLLTEEKIKYD